MNRSHTRVALAGTVISAPTLLTLLPGNWFDESGQSLNRNVEPPHLHAVVHVSVGVFAGTVLLVSLLALLSPEGRKVTSAQDVAVAIPLLLAALYASFTYRVASAAVSGANIGAGLLFMLGIVVVPPLLMLATYNALRRRTRPDSETQGTSERRA